MHHLSDIAQDLELLAVEESYLDEPIDWPEHEGVDFNQLADFGGERERD